MLDRMLTGQTIRRSATKPPHYYQTEAVEAVEKSWDDLYLKTLIAMPTGSGKGFVTGELCARGIERGERCLFLCHRRELVRKPAMEFEQDFGCPVTIEMGNHCADDAPMVFASVQTMQNRIRSGKWSPDTFQRIIVDEGHRVLGGTHRFVAEHFASSGAKMCICTATPRRGDKRSLMEFCDNLAYDIPLDRLISEGFLAEIVIQEESLNIEVHGASKTGDITDEEAGEAIAPYLEKAAELTIKYGSGKCGLSFLPLRKLAVQFRNLLRDGGMKAEYVAGASGGENCVSEDEQKRIKHALEMGDIEHVCNAQLWGEGTDVRPLNFGVDLRPTRSWPEHMQKYGRFTRTFDPAASYALKGCKWPKKTFATILDFCFASDEHNPLQRPATIFAKDDEEARAITAEISKGGSSSTTNLLAAFKAVKSAQESALQKRLEEMKFRKSRLVSVLDFSVSTSNLELAQYEPMSKWEFEVMTPGQRDYLSKNKFDLDTVQNRGHASRIVEALIQRQKDGLATIPQVQYAQSLGLSDAASRTFEDVSSFITLAKQGANPLIYLPD